MRRLLLALAAGASLTAGAAIAEDLKIALVHGRTGPLEAYAKQTETGLRMGFEYATKGTMEIDGRKIVIVLKDDQSKPDIAKTALQEAYEDDKVALAIGKMSFAKVADAAWFDIITHQHDGEWYEAQNPVNLARNIDIPVYLQINQGRGWTIDGGKISVLHAPTADKLVVIAHSVRSSE